MIANWRLRQASSGIDLRRMSFGLLGALCLAIPGLLSADTPRLVRAEVSGDTLAEALPRVGKSVGASLRAGPNVAEMRWFLFIHDQPLSTTRVQFQSFLSVPPGKASWFRHGSALVLDDDVAGRNARREAGLKRRRFVENHRRAGVERMLTRMQPAPGEDPRGARRRAQPLAYARIFSGLPPQAQRAAFGGQRIEVAYRDLTPAAQELVRTTIGTHRTSIQGRPELSFDGRKDYAQVVVVVRPSGTVSAPGLFVWLRGGKSQSGPSFPDIVNVPEWNPKEGWDWSNEYRAASIQRRRRSEKVTQDPSLKRQVTLKGGPEQTIEQVLRELSLASGLPIIGEYDPCFGAMRDRRISLENGAVKDLPVWQALDVIAKRFDLDWDCREGWIWVRSPRTVLSWSGELDLSPPDDRASTPSHHSH